MAYVYKGIEYQRNKLNCKRTRVNLRYAFYEMKNAARDFGISTPPELMYFNSVVGWCATSVDTLADRLQFREFRNDTYGINEIYAQNNKDILFDNAVLSALISSCCFIYIAPDSNGFPRLQIIDGGNATGIINPINGTLYEGYAVLERDKNGNPMIEAYFTAEKTEVYYSGNKIPSVFPHSAGVPLLVPVIYKPDARRPFGHSRISRASMSITESALRTIKRGEISAEFYSFPQKYITGLSQDAEVLDSWKAAMSAMMTFDKDEDGDHPIVGQFTQQSMEPHLEQLKMFASLFAGETGLTLDDMGFPTDNPSSSEAIKAAHENLRLKARKAQRCFNVGFLNAGYIAASVRDNIQYKREELANTICIWEPIFEPDAASLSVIGDSMIKLSQAFPGYIDEVKLKDLTGI